MSDGRNTQPLPLDRDSRPDAGWKLVGEMIFSMETDLPSGRPHHHYEDDQVYDCSSSKTVAMKDGRTTTIASPCPNASWFARRAIQVFPELAPK